MKNEALLEQMEKRESYMILYRFQNAVKNLLKAKQKKRTFISKNWIDSFDIPNTTCEYTETQWEMVQDLKKDLEDLAMELGFIFQENQC